MSRDFNFSEHWRLYEPLLKTDGKWDVQKIKNELHDLIFIMDQVSEVYSALTGGMLSKQTYYADTIINLHNEELAKERAMGAEDALEEADDEALIAELEKRRPKNCADRCEHIGSEVCGACVWGAFIGAEPGETKDNFKPAEGGR